MEFKLKVHTFLPAFNGTIYSVRDRLEGSIIGGRTEPGLESH